MTVLSLVRYYHPEVGERVGLLLDGVVHDVADHLPTISAFLRSSVNHIPEALEGLSAIAADSTIRYDAALFENSPQAFIPHWLPPVDEAEVWAAGVTYERSREARQEEAQDGGDVYARVYDAERPELFFKANGWRVVGPRAEVGIRADATWSVPEPELAVVFNAALEVVGFTVGNDMSSRDIEGANPLYLPQAKVYKASCALGPGILLAPSLDWPQATIRITIRRAGSVAFMGEVHTDRIKRRIDELAGYLGRSSEFPDGVILLTGTGIVPPTDFTLQAGDNVEITIDGIGTLLNTVTVV